VTDQYGKVFARMWTDPKFRDLSPLHRLSWVYVLTCPEHRSEGLFRVDVRDGARSIGISSDELVAHLEEFDRLGMCAFDPTTDLVLLWKSLGYSRVRNGNDAKGIVNRIKLFHRHWMVGALLELAERYEGGLEPKDRHLTTALRLHCNEIAPIDVRPEPNDNQTETNAEPNENPLALALTPSLTLTPEEHSSPATPTTDAQLDANLMPNTNPNDQGDGGVVAVSGPSFDEYWDEYPNKSEKAPAKKAWARLSAEDQQACFDAVPDYIAFVASQRATGFDLRYRGGAVFINKRTWEDDLSPRVEPSQPNRATVVQREKHQMISDVLNRDSGHFTTAGVLES